MTPPVDAATLVLRDGVIMLGAALAFVMLFRRLGLGAVLGYLVAGALIGPDGLGLISAPEEMLHIADFGIVLLLFLVGLELHPERLWRLRHDIFGLGLLQVAATGLALTALVHAAAGFSWPAALAIGLPLALSSTAQVLPSLRSDGSINTPAGERAFSILLFQDLSIVPLITIVAALSRAPADPLAPPGWQLALYTIGAIAGLVLAGRFLINPLFRLVGRISERELFIVAGLFIVLASAAVMEALHLSTALGAFVAGVMLADLPYRHEIEADIDPFRSILLGLFFLAIGMTLDLGAITGRPLFVLGMAAALIAIKAAVLFGLARAFRMKSRRALKLGLLLSQGGEFGFVLFAAAQNAMLITPEAASLFGAVVTVSMATTPFLMMVNDWLDRRSSRRAGDHLDGPELSAVTQAIVVGYGRFGQTVAQMLMAKGITVTLIDYKPAMIEIAGDFGMKVYYGDGTRLDLLRLAGAAEARALLFCVDGNGLTARKLEPILEAFPQAAVFVRAYDRLHLIELAKVDIKFALRELFELGIAMGREALRLFCIDDEEVDRVEGEYRRRDEERLESQRASGDIHALKERMFGPDNPLADRARKDFDVGGRRRLIDERPADSAGQHQRGPLLVVRHPGGETRWIGVGGYRQPDPLEMRRHPFGIVGGAKAARRRQAEGEDHADRHRLAVAHAGFRLDRMAEAVAEIEQGAFSLAVALVARDQRRLRRHAGLDRMEPRRFVAGEQRRAFRLAPGEEVGIGDQPVFHHLGIARPELAFRKAGERARVDQHHRRRVEGADQILALARVDAGLAAHRRIGLGQEGRRHRDPAAPPLQHRRREAGDVADHAAADGDDMVLAPDPRLDHGIEQGFERRHGLAAFAGRERKPPGEVGAEPVRPARARDILVGHQEQPALRKRGLADQPVADHDRIAERVDPPHRPASASTIRSTMRSCGSLSLAIVRWAWA